MQMNGDFLIAASRESVWSALNNPQILQRAIPGCQSVNVISGTEMEATLRLKVGPISLTFKGNVILSDLMPPESYCITGSGSGGRAGSAQGAASVRLAEEDGATRLTYDVNVKVTGKIAQLGSKLIDVAARKLANQFFETFSELAVDVVD